MTLIQRLQAQLDTHSSQVDRTETLDFGFQLLIKNVLISCLALPSLDSPGFVMQIVFMRHPTVLCGIFVCF